VTKDWREEVRDILEENQFDSPASGESPRSDPEPDQPRGPWLDAFGGWLRRRFATTNEMLVTAASLVVLGLLLYATPLRPVAAIFALAGGITFVLAIGRGIIERRSGSGTGTGAGPARPSSPQMWRGQVIDLNDHRPAPTIGDRIRSWFRRRR